MKKIDNASATVDNEFTDGNPGTGTPATILPGAYLNVIQAELIKIVEMAGITPDQTGADTEQIAKALAVHVGALDFYSDGGAANDYVLSPIGSGDALNVGPPALYEGMKVRFIPDNSNTGAATINVDAIVSGTPGDINIKVGAGAGSDPASGSIVAGVLSEFYYDATNSCFKPSIPSASAGVEIYDSGAQTFTAGGSLSLSHGLAGKPQFVSASLIAVANDDGYVIGEEFVINPHTMGANSGASRGISLKMDSSDVDVQIGSSAEPMVLIDGGDGAYRTATPASYDVRIVALYVP